MIVTCGIFLYSTRLKKLLLCHPTNSRWNNWSIPKGLMEAGEQPFDVAVRELREETGVTLDNIRVLATFPLPSRKYKKQNKVLESFLVITDSDFDQHQFTSNQVDGKPFAEHDQWKWSSLTDAQKVIHESQAANIPDIDRMINEFLAG